MLNIIDNFEWKVEEKKEGNVLARKSIIKVEEKELDEEKIVKNEQNFISNDPTEELWQINQLE